jgi:hypothetical protein
MSNEEQMYVYHIISYHIIPGLLDFKEATFVVGHLANQIDYLFQPTPTNHRSLKWRRR